jgi:hypothetical protein
MKIDYENPVIMNIHKQWDGETDDGIKFVIDGGYNDYDGYYIESIIFTDEIENDSTSEIKFDNKSNKENPSKTNTEPQDSKNIKPF